MWKLHHNILMFSLFLIQVKKGTRRAHTSAYVQHLSSIGYERSNHHQNQILCYLSYFQDFLKRISRDLFHTCWSYFTTSRQTDKSMLPKHNLLSLSKYHTRSRIVTKAHSTVPKGLKSSYLVGVFPPFGVVSYSRFVGIGQKR